MILKGDYVNYLVGFRLKWATYLPLETPWLVRAAVAVAVYTIWL